MNSILPWNHFDRHVLWLDPHAQTMLANTMRDMGGVFFHRIRLDTPDGDFLDLDFASIPGIRVGPQAPLVLLLHGLEGSARRGYACEVYKQLAGVAFALWA